MSKRLSAIVLVLGASFALAIAGPAAVNQNEGVIAPALLSETGVAPEYPPAAFEARIEGVVTVAALVLKDGSVQFVETVESTHPNLGFEQAVADAVQQWRFEPAQKDGQTVDAFSVVTFQFRRQGQAGSGYVAAGFVPLEMLGTSIVANKGLIGSAGAQAGDAAMGLSSADDPERGAYTPKFPKTGPGGAYHYKDWWPPREQVKLQASSGSNPVVK